VPVHGCVQGADDCCRCRHRCGPMSSGSRRLAGRGDQAYQYLPWFPDLTVRLLRGRLDHQCLRTEVPGRSRPYLQRGPDRRSLLLGLRRQQKAGTALHGYSVRLSITWWARRASSRQILTAVRWTRSVALVTLEPCSAAGRGGCLLSGKKKCAYEQYIPGDVASTASWLLTDTT
jgi:hypothetical protein